jgi:hypothetical protein
MTTMLLFAVLTLLTTSVPVAQAAACEPPCSSTQTCQQVFNSQAYECVDSTTACEPACTAAEVCKQVVNSQAYECVAIAAASATAPTASPGDESMAISPTTASPAVGATESGRGSGLSSARRSMLLSQEQYYVLMHHASCMHMLKGWRIQNPACMHWQGAESKFRHDAEHSHSLSDGLPHACRNFRSSCS